MSFPSCAPHNLFGTRLDGRAFRNSKTPAQNPIRNNRRAVLKNPAPVRRVNLVAKLRRFAGCMVLYGGGFVWCFCCSLCAETCGYANLRYQALNGALFRCGYWMSCENYEISDFDVIINTFRFGIVRFYMTRF